MLVPYDMKSANSGSIQETGKLLLTNRKLKNIQLQIMSEYNFQKLKLPCCRGSCQGGR
jgi:hypothetical protein